MNLLAARLDDPLHREILQSSEGLEFRLRRVFQQLAAQNKRLLLVLDDFEHNLESRAGGFVPTTEAAGVLGALVQAVRESGGHRVIVTCRYDFEAEAVRYFYKQPLDGMRDADLRKLCDRLPTFAPSSIVDSTSRQRAKRLGDGNPRLLGWLNQVLPDEKLDLEAVLGRLEGAGQELREKVLGAALLAQMDDPMRELLGRGLVFELPVPVAALRELGAGLNDLEGLLGRAVGLGLLEVSPDGAVRVPRILPLGLPEDEGLAAAAARVLYRLWYQEAETSTEEQRLEIHRLALAGEEGNIAAEMADRLTASWNNSSRFRETVALSQKTLTLTADYRVLHNLARAERSLGEVDAARDHYQQALQDCPPEDEREKASILHNSAELNVQQGQVEEAIRLYQESLALKEQIGNVQGKAATLHCLAIIYANQG